MPRKKNKGGRPSLTTYLESRIAEIKQFAEDGQTIEAIAAEVGVSRRTLSPFMRDNGIERNRDTVNHAALNNTAENQAIIKRKVRHHVRKYMGKYNLRLDGGDKNYKGRFRSNHQKISQDTIESEANFIAAKCLKSYDPTDENGASFGTYLERALEAGMNQVSRIGYDNARFINLSTSSNIGNDEGPADSITGVEVGIENMLAVDGGGNGLGLMGGKGFEAMLLETSWTSAPHVRDKRIFHCFKCHTDYQPHAIDKPTELSMPDGWKARRYACPFCGDSMVFFTSMQVPGLFSGHEAQRRAHKRWNEFFPRTYKVLEEPTSISQFNTRRKEGEQHDATGEVRAHEIAVARGIRWQGPVYCARKLLRSIAEQNYASSERLRKLPGTLGKQVKQVPYGMAS